MTLLGARTAAMAAGLDALDSWRAHLAEIRAGAIDHVRNMVDDDYDDRVMWTGALQPHVREAYMV